MKKPQHFKIRSAARSASRAQEELLVQRAERLLKDPDLAFPKCRGSCWFCVFKRGRRSLDKVREAAEDERRLEAMTERGNDFAKAYAALLLIRKKGRAPYLFAVKTPFGDITYALRGSAKKERLIGMQNFDHPKARLVAVMDIVRAGKLHVFSFADGMVCTGKSPAPPEGFVDYAVGQLKVKLTRSGRDYLCRHMLEARGERRPGPHLEIEWLPARARLRFCERCAQPGENSLLTLLTMMAIPTPRKHFRVSPRGVFECAGDCGSCALPEVELDKETLEDYLHGKVGDRALVERQRIKGLRMLRESGARVFVLGKRCFGDSMKAFIDAINPAEEERVGLEAVLRRMKGPVVVEGETAGRVLEDLWGEWGGVALEAVCGDAEVASRVAEQSAGSKKPPGQLLKDAIACVRQKELISRLPVYRRLPEVAKFADDMTRVYLTRGAEDTARAIERYKTEDSGVKSTAYAFLLAMGMQASKEWQYMVHEVEFADYLLPHVRKLLASKPEEYHANLQALLSATGSTESIPEPAAEGAAPGAKPGARGDRGRNSKS
ncbi:MAG: hypothetical protein ACUVV6_00920 [Thermoplasmatota archaeon]